MKICSEHRDYEVPLIYTFAWNYNEYWCPYCDKHEGMLGSGEDVEDTEELKKRLELYKQATKEYRHAMGVLVCSSTEWEGVQTKPEDLPEEEKNRLKEVRKKGWKLNVKIEKIELKTLKDMIFPKGNKTGSVHSEDLKQEAIKIHKSIKGYDNINYLVLADGRRIDSMPELLEWLFNFKAEDTMSNEEIMNREFGEVANN